MVGLGALALGAAPLAGGVLLGGMAGKSQPNVPDLRTVIKSEVELLQLIPEDQVARRVALKQMIGQHIDDLLVAQEKSREFQRKTRYFTDRGHWRDIVLFLCVVLFTIIWWDVDHSRGNWLPMFILLILLSVVTAAYTFRGVLRSASSFARRRHGGDRRGGLPGGDLER